MKKTVLQYITMLAIMLFALASCQKETNYKDDAPQLPSETFDYKASGFSPNSIFGGSFEIDLDDDKATLGRVLFYDKKLSINNSTSCNSCHLQSQAFSDNVAFSQGFNNKNTLRNSPPITNPLSQGTFFWDSRADDLSEMVLMPVSDHIEMGLESLDDLEKKLTATSYYPQLFRKAYGDQAISQEMISDALATFVSAISTSSSRYDDHYFVSNGTILTDEEQAGFEVFNSSGCGSCHGGTDFRGGWGDDWANIGLDMTYSDQGLGSTQNDLTRNGMFKIPTLRNIELTAPYMHDGRFGSLREVIGHYTSGIQPHENLDERLKENEQPRRLDLTEQEINQLIAFLKTLTDYDFINAEQLSDPFTN